MEQELLVHVHQLHLLLRLLQDQQEKVVRVEQEPLQELQDHVFKEVVVEVVEHNIHLHNQEVLVVVEQVVRVKVDLHLLHQVMIIPVQVEVVIKMDQQLEEQVVQD